MSIWRPFVVSLTKAFHGLPIGNGQLPMQMGHCPLPMGNCSGNLQVALGN